MKYSLEIIRLFAVILITFTHTRNDFHEHSISFYIFEELPKIGTTILSIISGYLYAQTAKTKTSIFRNKVKTLLIPFLIANLIVIAMAAFAHYFFGINFLNRLDYSYSLFTEGLLSLNSPPINPPTYFIRDLFIVFVLIELVRYRNFYMLLIILPLAFWGELMLRFDILLLFITGYAVSLYAPFIIKYKSYCMLALSISVLVLMAANFGIAEWKYPLSLLIFFAAFNLSINFFNVGAFTYLLHLYHSPIMVTSFPLINMLPFSPAIHVIIQILTALAFAYLLCFLTRKYSKLQIICGGK